MRNLLVSYWRSLTHRPGFALLNIGGLALGIAVFVVLALFVRFETGFDRWWPGADQVYLVEDHWTLSGVPATTSPNTMGGLVEQMRADFAGLLGTSLRPTDATVRTADGAIATEPFGLVDTSFFKVFDWPFAAGSAATALADPASLVVTQAFARRYFGSASPLGRSITLTVGGIRPPTTSAPSSATCPRRASSTARATSAFMRSRASSTRPPIIPSGTTGAASSCTPSCGSPPPRRRVPSSTA